MHSWSWTLPSKKITVDELHDLLLEAAETERRLPPALRKTPAGWWPTIVPEWLSYADETTTTRLASATGKQVDNYDLVLEIITSVPSADDRSLLWAVGQSAVFRDRGPAWRKIGKIRHTDRRKVKSHYEVVLIETAMRWNHVNA